MQLRIEAQQECSLKNINFEKKKTQSESKIYLAILKLRLLVIFIPVFLLFNIYTELTLEIEDGWNIHAYTLWSMVLIYSMVARNMMRMYEGKKSFLTKKIVLQSI